MLALNIFLMLFLSVRSNKTKIMFRKLISNLPFSPALVGQLGFYARRLKREEATRRLGLIFTVLALVVQSFAVFSPPEPANAANPSDFIYGGITSKEQFLSAYDASARGNGDLKKIFDYAGITRADLTTLESSTINSRGRGTGAEAWLSWGRAHRFSASEGEVKHRIDSTTTVYSKPLWLFDSLAYTKKNGSTYPALKGTSKKMGQFAIMKDCGNLITTRLPSPPPPNPPKPPQPVSMPVPVAPRAPEVIPTPAPVPTPVAPLAESRCNSLQMTRIERTKYSLSAGASVTNGATISAYTFRVKNSSNAVVYEQKVNSNNSSATSGVFTLAETGNYTASVTVTTSEGDRSGSHCETLITVSPADRCELNPDLTKEDAECKPCVENTNLWYKDKDCAPQIASDKEATNLTRGNAKADTITANSSDRIEYKVTLYNVGKIPVTSPLEEELADVLEYATLQDNGGASFNNETKVLSWGNITLKPGEKTVRTFVVAVLAEVPSTPQGTSDPTSYDCTMMNSFGNTIYVKVNCEAPKIVETVVSELPSTGPGENIMFAGIVGSFVTYFYARSRQMTKEVRLIRKDFNMGTL